MTDRIPTSELIIQSRDIAATDPECDSELMTALADRLAELDKFTEVQANLLAHMNVKVAAIEQLRLSIPCPTCDGKKYHDAALEYGDCPDCVDGHPSWERMAHVFTAVFDSANDPLETAVHQTGQTLSYAQGHNDLINPLRSIR